MLPRRQGNYDPLVNCPPRSVVVSTFDEGVDDGEAAVREARKGKLDPGRRAEMVITQ